MRPTDDSITPALQRAGRMLVEPDTYTDDMAVHQVCRILREQAPIHFVDHPEYPSLWTLTRHRDIREVELHNKAFLQGRHSFLLSLVEERRVRDSAYPRSRTIIHRDGQDHRDFRGLTAAWFTPRNLERLNGRIADLARWSVNKMVEMEGSCDFAQDIASDYPLQVILSLLGLPEADYPFLLQVSKAMAGAQDPEVAPGMEREDALAVFFQYFTELTDERRARPTEDLASIIANAKLPGDVSLELGDTVWYYIIFAVAGHDTTTRSIVGGLRALIEHPKERARLRADPTLLDSAANEVVRWVTPIKHVTRVACQSHQIADHTFEAGDILFLSYPAANFDPEAFDRPFAFDVGRSPNDHLAFGLGAHYCLGAQLARMEIRAMLDELVPRLRSVELAGEPQLTRSNMVGGLKHLPIRYIIDEEKAWR